ncbi:MAG: hypothetical protein HY680_07480, partial [Chloroflexi bacterium]|nr:hypothetical protein [Chloroflexota bacterium]
MAARVLDTSAIMCVLFQEEGADQVVKVLEASRASSPERSEVLLPFMALMETEYWLLRRLPEREAQYHLLV